MLYNIDHFVVLMLENRSFDNLFGQLPGVNGLTGDETNPNGKGGSVHVWNTPQQPADSWLPKPDPGELFTDITAQLGIDPPGRPMSGFAANYVAQGGQAADIMHYFVPAQVPALSALASSYAVCDEWFASAPCQTWPNRFFVHTGTANGYENNSPPHFPYLMPTIFNALNSVAPNGWEIYYHDFPQALTLSRLWTHLDRFRPFSEFLDDAKLGHLPSYSFIDPRYSAALDWPNDMHPPHNISYADQLVQQVYDALRASPNWNSTLLIVLFDEHGGCYDHVLPGKAVPPEVPRRDQVFKFDRYGVRIPAVLVSPWIAPGTVLRAPAGQTFDHTSIISTLRKRFGIDTPLTARDAAAPDVEAVLNLDQPSDEGRQPVQALTAPASDDAAALQRARLEPLNDFQQALHSTAAHLIPLLHGVDANDHIAALINGYLPNIPPAVTPLDTLPYLQNVVKKLLP